MRRPEPKVAPSVILSMNGGGGDPGQREMKREVLIHMLSPDLPRMESDYRTQSRDTSLEAECILIEAYRRMTPSEKAQRITAITQVCTQLAVAGICARYPDADEEEIRLRLAALKFDRETMVRAFGWDPGEKGY